MMTKDDYDFLARAARPGVKLKSRERDRALGLLCRIVLDIHSDRELLCAESIAQHGPDMWDLPEEVHLSDA